MATKRMDLPCQLRGDGNMKEKAEVLSGIADHIFVMFGG
jgi:hypothetical protein